MGEDLIFDKSNFSLKKVRHTLWDIISTILVFFFGTLTFAALAYTLIAVVFSTDKERRLSRENRMYEKVFSQMEERKTLVEDVVLGLESKDNAIYKDIFHTNAPSVNPAEGLDLIQTADTISDRHIVRYTSRKADRLLSLSEKVDAAFARAFDVYECDTLELPPLSLPLEKASYAQIGGSLGSKVNPFYKVPMQHNGLDIIAPQGDKVIASASGYVSDVIYSRKGMGNVVEITHPGGYVTRYCHLIDIRVRKKMVVKRGTHIGNVGISGNAFAPHLHYEILKDGENVDPVNYFFASVTPDEYANMLYMSVYTQQSMD